MRERARWTRAIRLAGIAVMTVLCGVPSGATTRPEQPLVLGINEGATDIRSAEDLRTQYASLAKALARAVEGRRASARDPRAFGLVMDVAEPRQVAEESRFERRRLVEPLVEQHLAAHQFLAGHARFAW